jgi:hypothetical protein
MANNDIETIRTAMEAAGFRPSEQDLQRLTAFLGRRQPVPVPRLESEPWAMPATRRWKHG